MRGILKFRDPILRVEAESDNRLQTSDDQIFTGNTIKRGFIWAKTGFFTMRAG